MGTVRDEASFDHALPELEKVVQDVLRTAVALSQLNPPAAVERESCRKLIADGHWRAEPTGGEMLRFIGIESRQKALAAWMDSFTAAGQEVGAEFSRLYGPVDSGGDPEIRLEPR